MCPLDLSDGFEHNAPLRIILIGCGKMGSAMMHNWIGSGRLEYAEILDPNEPDETLTQHQQVDHITNFADLSLDKAHVVILATKPQIMDDICKELKEHLPEDMPILSIAAGKSISYFEKQFGKDTPIIRTMPNTPAAIGKGITALCANDATQENHKNIANALMYGLGEALWVDDEALIDSVTAVSGSGPAYVFHLIEVMAKAGEKAGLSTEQSMRLARQTVIGASALAEHEATETAQTLRQNVTSPNGTTQAALDVLMDGRLQALFDEAILAAQKRSKELSD